MNSLISGSSGAAISGSSTFLGGTLVFVCSFWPACSVYSAINIFSCLTIADSLDNPSTSSNNFSLFLFLSTELVSSWRVVGPSAPVMLALCL
jgi:hypothetical protein